MSENILLLVCGLVSSDRTSELSLVGIAMPRETPYDFSTRLLRVGYGRATTIFARLVKEGSGR